MGILCKINTFVNLNYSKLLNFMLGNSMNYVKSHYLLLIGIIFCLPAVNLIGGSTLNFNVGQAFTNDSEMTAGQKINLQCGGILSGNGLFKAPEIEITAKTFRFTGTIECTGTCKISTQEPFDATMFKRKGNGKFIIAVVAPQEQLNQASVTQEPVAQTSTTRHFTNRAIPPRVITVGTVDFTVKTEAGLAMAEAIQAGDLARVKNLVECNHDFSNNADEKNLCMLMAGFAGHMHLVKEFINLGANVNGTVNSNGISFPYLIVATLENHKDFVQALLSHGVSPNVYDTNQRTALMYAAKNGFTEIVDMLLKAGADKHMRDVTGLTVFDHTPTHQKRVVELLNASSTNDAIIAVCVGAGIVGAGYLIYRLIHQA
jgi:hypothetical protein